MDKTQVAELYDIDFHSWINHNVELLKNGDIKNCDLKNIIEELESMGNSEIRELHSRLVVLMAHLLKYEYQPEQQSTSWNGTISEQRRQIKGLLDYSPSLYNKLVELLNSEKVKKGALEIFTEETGLPPVSISYTVDQILDNNFIPNYKR